MAKLPDATLTTIFHLLRQTAEGIENASATEWRLFEEYGETEATIPELEELLSARERLNASYSRLNTLLLGILEAQPFASADMLELMVQTIEQTLATLDAVRATIREVKRNWDLS